MAHFHEKIGGCSRSSRSFTCLISDRGGEEIIRWLATKDSISTTIYIVKRAHNLNPTFLSLTFVKKGFFNRTHETC